MRFPPLTRSSPAPGPDGVGTGFVENIAGHKSNFNYWKGKINSAVKNNRCDGAVSPGYVELTAFPAATILGVRTRGREIVAFVICKRGASRDDLYIDVLCGPKQGVAMMRAVFAYGREHGFSTVSLSALPHVDKYYEKYGFLPGNGDPCRPGAMAKRVAAQGGGVNYGYRLRKCLRGTTEANNIVNEGNARAPYVLPPRATHSTVTRQTWQTRLTASASRRGRGSNAVDSGEVSSTAFRAKPTTSLAVPVCRAIHAFVKGGKPFYMTVLKPRGVPVRLKCTSSPEKLTVDVELWRYSNTNKSDTNGSPVPGGSSYRYDSSKTIKEVIKKGNSPWLASLGPCLRDAEKLWAKKKRGSEKKKGSPLARARRVLSVARSLMARGS